MPFFSVIIATFNRSSFLCKAIDSVLQQTFRDFELLIIDDGSTDDTSEVVKRFNDSRIKYYFIKNSERGFARNYGIKLAQGNYLSFLDSDDYFKENHLHEGEQFIFRNAQPAIFFHRYDYINLNTGLYSLVKFPKKNTIQSLSKSNLFFPTCAFVKTNIMLENLFDNDRDFVFSEDLYVWLKIGSKYGLLFSDLRTCVAVDHSNTSMNLVDPNCVIYCRDKLINLLQKEPAFQNEYFKCLKYLYCNLTSLSILLYTEQKLFKKPILLFVKLLFYSPDEFKRKRTYVIIRNLMINMFRPLKISILNFIKFL